MAVVPPYARFGGGYWPCQYTAAPFQGQKTMQIADFLQKYISPKAITLIAYEAEITSHLDAYLQQIFPEGRILIVTEAYWREYAERTLIPSLKAHGCETEYCLCVKTAGVPYSTQIEESLADGALSGIVGIAALGTHDLFEAVRDRAAFLDIACCALLHELPRQDVLNSCGENRPTADALFFDLNAIMQQLHGDGREKSLELEIDTYALSADIAVAKAMGSPIPAGVSEAIHEAVPPRLPQGKLTEDDLAELCEAYMWRAAAARLMPSGSFCTVMEYLNDGADFPSYSITDHAQIMASIFDAALELESLEISPEDCASRMPPKEILARTLQQILLEDGLRFEWLKKADENFQTRNDLRLSLNALTLAWDDFCAQLRPIADMMHVLSSRNTQDEEAEEPDSTLKNVWIHAAKFAAKNSFLKVFNDLGIIEPALYI